MKGQYSDDVSYFSLTAVAFTSLFCGLLLLKSYFLACDARCTRNYLYGHTYQLSTDTNVKTIALLVYVLVRCAKTV